MSSAAWRSVGINYVRYSQICAQAVRRCLKADFKNDAAKREDTVMRTIKWQDGKPIKVTDAEAGKS